MLLQEPPRFRRRFEVRNILDVDVDRIEETPIGRVIRTRAVAIGEQRMQRIERDDGASGRRRGGARLAQRREIANALVTPPAKRVQVRGESETASAIAQGGGKEAGARHDDEPAGRTGWVIADYACSSRRQASGSVTK